MNIKQRGVAAAGAYLERSGHAVLEPETAAAPETIDILSIEGDTLVATLVRVSQRSAEAAPVPERTLDAALSAIADYCRIHHPECDCVRVDVISILIIAEDRALLRHHLGERSG
jgi:putative endonuclease